MVEGCSCAGAAQALASEGDTAAPREAHGGERAVEGRLITVHLATDTWIEIEGVDRGKSAVISVDGRALQASAVGLRGQHVVAFVHPKPRRGRLVLSAIVSRPSALERDGG